jgi:hypothetical protein
MFWIGCEVSWEGGEEERDGMGKRRWMIPLLFG